MELKINHVRDNGWIVIGFHLVEAINYDKLLNVSTLTGSKFWCNSVLVVQKGDQVIFVDVDGIRHFLKFQKSSQFYIQNNTVAFDQSACDCQE